MNRKELKANIEGYNNAISSLRWKYNDLDRLIESGDQEKSDTLMTEISEIESRIFVHGPTVARAICEFIKKDYIKTFDLDFGISSTVACYGLSKTLIEWGQLALLPTAIRPRFSDKTVEIVGVQSDRDYIEILTENLTAALKGLRVTHTVQVSIFGESIKLGISGLKEMLKLTGDKLRLSINPDTKYLIIKDAGSSFTVKPWAWDRAKAKKKDPATFFGIYDHNRKIQLTAR